MARIDRAISDYLISLHLSCFTRRPRVSRLHKISRVEFRVRGIQLAISVDLDIAGMVSSDEIH